MKRLSAISWIGMTMVSSLALFYACEDSDKIQTNEQSALTEDLRGVDPDLPSYNNNPFYCTTGDNLYAGCITWYAGGSNPQPWNGGSGLTRNGWLYPSICFVRQVPDDACPSNDLQATYYPMKSELADGTTVGGGTIYSGSYLYVTYHLETW